MDSVSVALHAVAVQRWLSIVAVLSGIAVPLYGIAAMRRWSAQKPAWQVSSIWISGCSGLLLYASAAYIFGVCWGGEIGESGKNRLARALGSPVVGALEIYHRQRGLYPDDLDALVPTYLSEQVLRAPESSVLHYPFEYRTDSAGYELTVRYSGPGMNHCRRRPKSDWQCSGYF